MKTIKVTLFVIVAMLYGGKNIQAQTINWASLQPEQRHMLNLNAKFDYSFAYGIGYGYHLKSTLPVVLTLDHTQAVGEEMLDDFKTRIGGQVRVYQLNNVQFTAKIQGVFRRFENDNVRLLNFGSDLSATIGYYKPTWFAAGEFGFDKAIVTHFKHSDLFRGDFPEVKDGWYNPSTGGNFYYGVQTGVSFDRNDVTIKLGKVVQQDFKTSSTIPYYFQIGYNRRF